VWRSDWVENFAGACSTYEPSRNPPRLPALIVRLRPECLVGRLGPTDGGLGHLANEGRLVPSPVTLMHKGADGGKAL
jgi:hypothetical protein